MPTECKTNWKGIILAGGSGSRLFPLTKSVSKQLLPVYDKPMIYYPLSVLMLSGIRDIAIITDPSQTDLFVKLLGDGSQWGCTFTYLVQEKPKGIGEAFLISKDFLKNSNCCLILGDNLFFGQGLFTLILKAMKRGSGATVFGYHVHDPQRYGVVEADPEGNVISLEEKPLKPKSNIAVTGLYFYDSSVISKASNLSPSSRGELEITDINLEYLSANQLRVEMIPRGVAWLDTGTHESLLEAASFIHAVQERQGLLIASPDEIAWRMHYITSAELFNLGRKYAKNDYGRYLLSLLENYSY